MSKTPSLRLRLPLLETGDEPNAWGVTLRGLFGLVDDSQGAITVPVNGNVTLTNDNYVTNQARYAGLRLTGTGLAGNAPALVTIPAVDKWRIVKNDCAGDILIGTGSGLSATVRAGQVSVVLCDGTDTFVIDPSLDQIKKAVADLDLNGKRIVNAADGVNPTDFATLRQAANTIAMGFASQAQASATLAQAWAAQVSGEVVPGQGFSSYNYATKAGVSATLAQAWAAQTSGEVVVGQGFSAFNYATKAGASATLAQAWATQTTGEVVPGQGYSAYYWAQQASTFAPGKATTTQAQAGTNDTTYMTPLKTAQAISALAAIFTGTRAISGADTISVTDRGKVLNLSGSFTLSATAAAALGSGFYCWLRKRDGAGTVVFDPNGTETVDGFSTVNIYQEAFLIWTDGAAWFSQGRPKGWVPVAKVTLAAQALSALGITAGFLDNEVEQVEITFDNLTQTNSAFVYSYAIKNSAVLSGANYVFETFGSSGSSTSQTSIANASNPILLASQTAGPLSGTIHVLDTMSTLRPDARFRLDVVAIGATLRGHYWDTTVSARIGGIQLVPASGTITSISYTVRGYRP